MAMTRAKEKAAELIVGGSTNANAARVCGVDVRTVTRWLKDSDFSKRVGELDARRREELARTVAVGLDGLAALAIATLKQAMEVGGPAAVKAALRVLEHTGAIRAVGEAAPEAVETAVPVKWAELRPPEANEEAAA